MGTIHPNPSPFDLVPYETAYKKEIMKELDERKKEEGTTFHHGKDLRKKGHKFFDKNRDYYLKPLPELHLIEVSSFNKYDEDYLDFDGRYLKECYYDWWYLDENLQVVPGLSEPLCETIANKRLFSSNFEKYQERASQILSNKKNGSG